MNITDVVRLRQTGELASVQGFQRLDEGSEELRGRPAGFQPCRAEDPRCCLMRVHVLDNPTPSPIGDIFVRPWTVEYVGPNTDPVQDPVFRVRAWGGRVDSGIHTCFSRGSRPDLIHLFEPLSQHDRLSLARWIRDQATACAAPA